MKMIKDKILISEHNVQSFDKMQIALAIRNTTYEDNLSCTLLENNILTSCEGCSLRIICNRLEEVVEEYRKDTSTVMTSFNFR